jgi:hypothetical protein
MQKTFAARKKAFFPGVSIPRKTKTKAEEIKAIFLIRNKLFL